MAATEQLEFPCMTSLINCNPLGWSPFVSSLKQLQLRRRRIVVL